MYESIRHVFNQKLKGNFWEYRKHMKKVMWDNEIFLKIADGCDRCTVRLIEKVETKVKEEEVLTQLLLIFLEKGWHKVQRCSRGLLL